VSAMSDGENSTGPHGSFNGTGWQPQYPRSLGDHGRQIQHDAQALAAAVLDATDGLGRYLTEQLDRRLYRTLGLAVGVGCVLGGGLSSRSTTALLGAARRLAMALAVRELAARLSHGTSASAQNPGSENASGAAKERG
jgi:hypothetical protein